MASQDFAQTRALLKRGVVGYVVDDTPKAIRIKNNGHTVTHVITTGAGSGATALELHDSDASTSIDLTAAAYDTLGELCDYINTLDNWEAKILDGLRSDSVNTKLLEETVAAVTEDGVTYYNVKWDTSIFKAYTYRLTYDKHTASSGKQKPKGSHRVSVLEIDYYADVNAAAADGVQVFECDGTVETQILSKASVDATETAITFASGNGKITSNDNCDLVIRVKDATSLTDNSLGHLTVIGELE